MAPIDPHQLLKALSPLLSHHGGIKGPDEALRIWRLMKDSSLKMVSKCIYINILKATESQETLDKFISLGGWDTLNMWLEDCRDTSNKPLLVEVLKVYHLLPVTVTILKQTNAAKTIKQLRKSEDDNIKVLASNIVDCWMKKIRENQKKADDHEKEKQQKKSDKRKDKEKSKDREKEKEREKEKDLEKSKSRDKHKDKKYDVEKRRKSEEEEDMDTSENKTTTYTKKEVQPGNGLKLHIKIERTPKSEPDSEKSQKQKTADPEKKRASTVKRVHVKPRSTGLEEDNILPPKKKSATTVDTNKPLPKRPGSEPKAVEPPEKKSRLHLTTPLTVSVPTTTPISTPPPVSPGEVHQGIKFTPPKPTRAMRHIHDSGGFMNAVISSSERTVGQMKKKKKAGAKPTTPTTPPSPISPTTAMAQRLPIVPSFYKDTQEDENKEEDDGLKMPELTKERSPSPTENSESKPLINGDAGDSKNMESNDVEMGQKDEKAADGSPPEDLDEKESVKSEESSNSGEAKGLLTTGATATKKHRKSVTWAAESHIKKIFYFELDESERENVNRVKDFGQMKKEEMQMDRRVMESAKRVANDKMQEAKPWYRPMLIDGLPGGFEHGKDSTERDIQKTRELGVLQAIFFTKDMLPDNPAEPENESTEPSEPKFIPLEDDSSAGEDFVYDSHPPQSGTSSSDEHVSVTLPAELANVIGSISGLGQGAAIDPSNPMVANIIASLVGGADAQDEAFNKLKTMLEPLNHGQQIQIPGFSMGPQASVFGPEIMSQGAGIRPPLLGLAPPGFSPVGPRGPRFPPPGPGGLGPGGPGLGQTGPSGMGGMGPFGPGMGPGPGRGRGNGDEWGENMMGGPMHGPPMGPIRGRGRSGMPARMQGPPGRMMRGSRPRGPRPRDSTPALCRHFNMGSCRFGNSCLFLHPGVNAPPL